MSLNFNKVQEQKLEFKRGKFIRPGVQNLILRDVTLETSKNTGSKRPVLHMETEPITDKDWEGLDGAKGQIGKIAGNFGFYFKNEEQQMDFASFLKSIMMSTGVYDDFMRKYGETNFNDIEEVIEAVKPYVKNTTARYFVCGEEYPKLDGSGKGLRLKFPTRKAVESINTPLSETKLQKFDDTNTNHFKRLAQADKAKDTKVDDLPF